MICILKALVLSILIISSTHAAPVPSTTNNDCSTIVVRKEIRQLSDGERNAFIDAIQKLKESGEYEKLVPIHNDYATTAHITPGFFPWHRYYIRLFESALQRINPDIVLPYWDWSIDSQAPEESEIFKWFGGNGQGPLQCVTDGPFANWRFRTPNDHCLRREFNGGDKILAIYSSEALNNMINTINNYDRFRDLIENGPHAAVHRGIGGDLAVLISPTEVGGMPSNECDQLKPFNITVDLGFTTTSKGYCYTYSPSPSFNTKTVAPPSKGLINIDLLKSLLGTAPQYSNTFGGPAPDDRQESRRIRIPYSIPLDYIQMFHGSELKVREMELNNAQFIQNINQIASYTSPNSLSMRNETIRQLIDMGRDIQTPYDNPDLPRPDRALPDPSRSPCTQVQ
ncbi:Di-copper centre-containing protein [Basidiobolus meristosporus CBS 931.73]|uniref:Di-copper centre-containing protein n=1 Tax=Basidiobolus meristosporus CBS 931.73 TaxID=1314790 RepID=A0A1Y1Z5B8_9FUNG|nr:Di-copper centre-containing protein [Basidiobolus meristosporus CBS 931.73]|eukprot:ORY04995.1 Di-copper centre-containing protein [Basidiobolus meristosporus CBS 931.73]